MGFVLAIGFASFQVHREYKWMASRSRADLEQAGGSSGDGEAISSADITRSMVSDVLILKIYCSRLDLNVVLDSARSFILPSFFYPSVCCLYLFTTSFVDFF